MKLEISTAAVAVMIASISLIISLLTYYRNSQSVQLKMEQTESMRIVAGQAIVVWDQLQTVITAQTQDYNVDSYVYTSLKQNCLRLEESLDRAVGLGLYGALVGNRSHALSMHTAFRQSLAWVRSLDPSASSPEDWTKMHLLMGMIRLLEQTKSFDSELLPKSVWKELSIPQEMSETAWSYLHRDDT